MPPELELSVDRGAGVPLGVQLASRIRAAVRGGALGAGDRLPSVRDLAEAAGVNVNTARAVYAGLESEGLVRREHGRGTFVAGPRGDEAATRRELRRQIAHLEAALVRLPPPPTLAGEPAVSPPGRATLLTAQDLEAVRDRLLGRLRELDAQRALVLERLEQLGVEESAVQTNVAEGPLAQTDADRRAAERRASPSLAGARIRWVGA
jgi:DNA-binding transcriptional regulator YhcF (GntR family)